uniref:Uncharacterized protein n=1 Tax=Lotus japonicus TaxID=34305 RepID=I3SD57_LOTJA|nr:unknown [Lotus japonicus]
MSSDWGNISGLPGTGNQMNTICYQLEPSTMQVVPRRSQWWSTHKRIMKLTHGNIKYSTKSRAKRMCSCMCLVKLHRQPHLHLPATVLFLPNFLRFKLQAEMMKGLKQSSL